MAALQYCDGHWDCPAGGGLFNFGRSRSSYALVILDRRSSCLCRHDGCLEAHSAFAIFHRICRAIKDT